MIKIRWGSLRYLLDLGGGLVVSAVGVAQLGGGFGNSSGALFRNHQELELDSSTARPTVRRFQAGLAVGFPGSEEQKDLPHDSAP